MEPRKLKLALIGAGIVACVAFLLVVTLRGGNGLVYYYTVSEFRKVNPDPATSVRINGKVASGSVVRTAGGLDVRFAVTDGNESVPVEYHGVLPDTFGEDSDVVVEGSLAGNGIFQASSLLAKCPSKYEAKARSGEKNPHADSRAKAKL